jgi:bacteriorhodopsin
MFSCPMLVLDLICTVDAKGKIMYPFMTFVVLFMGFMSYAEEGPARFAWFGIGMVVFAVFFFIMEKVFRKKLDEKKEIPVEHLELQRAMWCFFGFWPVFPFMWALGAQGAQVISPELDIVIHCFLDIGAKGAFTFFLMRYRLYEEDREGDEEDRAAKLASGGYSADTALAAQQYPQQGAPYGQEFDRMTIRST